jgi:predicted RNA-binding Zn-ribbon protein involved in translation (DUF1610 family)
MELVVRLNCDNCSTFVIVLPGKVMEAIGALGGIESELQFVEFLKDDKAKTGDRLAVADVNGQFTCPVCGVRRQLPPEDEIRRQVSES